MSAILYSKGSLADYKRYQNFVFVRTYPLRIWNLSDFGIRESQKWTCGSCLQIGDCVVLPDVQEGGCCRKSYQKKTQPSATKRQSHRTIHTS